MTKKPDLPAHGGSYVRNAKGLKLVQEPTRELTRREIEAASNEGKAPVDTDKSGDAK